MLLAFKLDMPNVGSWNGQWSGEGNCYARVINYTQKYGSSQKAKQKVKDILANGSYYYNFGGGWGMDVSVKEVNSKEAAALRKKSRGFCGYDWAIDSILMYGEILNTRQREKRARKEDA